MIQRVINHHKPIVNVRCRPDINRGILIIMTLYIKLKLAVYPFCVNSSQYPDMALVKQSQYRLVNVVINQHNPFLGTFNKVTYKNVSVEYLSVKQYAFFRRQ